MGICTSRQGFQGANKRERGNHTKLTVQNAGGDIDENLDLQDKNQFGESLPFRNVKDACTMTSRLINKDVATSPPSPSWRQPPPPNTPEVEVKNHPSEEALRRNRIMSVDTVGAFVGGVKTCASCLEITADDLDIAKKKLRNSACDSAGYNLNNVRRMLPMVVEDTIEDNAIEKEDQNELEHELKLKTEENLSDCLKLEDQYFVLPDAEEYVPINLQSSNNNGDDSDDVFLSNFTKGTANNKDSPIVELHSEPPPAEQLSLSSFQCKVSDASNASLTEEKLADMAFYNTPAVSQRCEHRLIDDKILHYSTSDLESDDQRETSCQDENVCEESTVEIINTLQSPPDLPSIPSRANESMFSLDAKFSVMSVDEATNTPVLPNISDM